MLEATPSLALLSLLKMALAGEHSSYKVIFCFGKTLFSQSFCFLKALRKLFRFVILVINWNFQIIKQSDLVEGELYVANVCFSLLMVILYIGDVVSIKTKAWIPSVLFVVFYLFLVIGLFFHKILWKWQDSYSGCHFINVSVDY